MSYLRWCMLGLVLAGCRSTEPGSAPNGALSSAPSSDTPLATSPRAVRTPQRPAPTMKEQDRIAEAVLVNYDSGRHRVRVKLADTDYSVGLKAGGFVTASIPFGMPDGQDARTYIDREGALLPVFVVVRPGTSWAAGKRVALLVIGSDPGMYGRDKGVLALINGDDTVELAGEWEKEGASSPQRPPALNVRFESVGLVELMLEEDTADSEGSTGESSFYRVWRRETVRGSDGKWACDAEHPIMTSYTDANERELHPGWSSSMTSTLTASARGLMVKETWTFKGRSETKTATVERLYGLAGNVITPDTKRPSP